ncbi:hypothetical protein LSTR_LSTR008309 [Laodelphax striatellus]|uniref:Glyoxylate reductase/hydroxypyruvate reductase n=1 Tax=Laodelphax striatellus TaxID=195883 RepID=A0A482XJI4_LAOST|nr:hypothetical protein LSTR_LSTR008309 [Laodelphax striatellus]
MHCLRFALSPRLFSVSDHPRFYSRLLSIRPVMSSSKPKIFVTRDDFPGIELLKQKAEIEIFKGTQPSKDEIIAGLKGKQAIYCSLNDKIDRDVLDACKDSLKVIGTMSVGVDHLDWRLCFERGIRIGYTPIILTEAVAELTMALLLATSRRLFEAHNEILQNRWSSWSPMWMCGPGLHEATVGIFGFGRIGQEVARKLKAFRVKKIIYSRSSPGEIENDVGAIKVDNDELLRESDFLIVLCSLNEKTQHFFNKERFAQMKSSAIFINVSRGGTVVQDDLIDALKRNVIRAAGLDVTTPEPLKADHPLLALPNCVVIPHIGSATYKSRNEMGEATSQNILLGLEGKPMIHEWKV